MIDPLSNENPDALAGAVGATSDELQNSNVEYRLRLEWAMTLRFVIERCDPTDAALIMSDALDRMRIGCPTTPLLNAMDEARGWAAWATPVEHKAYCLACYDAMPPKVQAGFLAHVSRRAAQ